MPDSLRAIAYLSTAHAAFSAEELEALLAGARAFNELAGITGALLVHDVTFFQYIEGPALGVQEVYARISRSTRHGGIVQLFDEEVGQREFPDWYMGFADAPRSVLLKLEQARWAEAVDEKPASAGFGRELLREFWRGARRYH